MLARKHGMSHAVYMSASPGQAVGRGISRNDPLVPQMWEILAVMALFVFYQLADVILGEAFYPAVNYTGPIGLGAILGYANWRMIRREGRNLWAALFWFRLSTLVYFGLGTMVIYVVNNFTRNYMESFFAFTEAEIFKHNLVVTLSVILTLIFSRLVLLRTRKSGYKSLLRAQMAGSGADRRLFISAMVFLGIGLFVNYVFVLPYRMGWTNIVLPGSVMNLKNMIPVGIFFITLWGLRNARWLLPAIWGGLAVQMLLALLMFAKAEMLMLEIMVALAFVWDRVTFRKLAMAGSIILATYFALKPIVSYARNEIGLRYGGNVQAGFGERFKILASYFDKRAGSGDVETDIQDGLSRLSYVNASTFVIHLYDSGRPGDWPKLLPAVFIPRILWKNKPIITNIGTEIYELGTGHGGSSSGAGIFADCYWAYGWGGVIIFMSAYGVIIGGLTRFSSNVMREGRWLYFPVVLMGMKLGMRTDGHYISDVPGALVILIAMYVLIRIIEKIIGLPARNVLKEASA